MKNIKEKAEKLKSDLFLEFGDRFIVKEILMEALRLTNTDMKNMILERKEKDEPVVKLSGQDDSPKQQGTLPSSE